jgi:hypothetical protein
VLATVGQARPMDILGGRALGNTVFAEEKDEALEMEQNGGLSGSVNPGVIGSGVYGISGSGSGGTYAESIR